MATLPDELLPILGNREVSYHDDLVGLDGRPEPLQRYRDLYREINAIARFLVEEVGVRKGDLVAIYKTNDVRYFRYFMGIIRAGGIAVPLNPLLQRVEVAKLLARCGARVLVTDTALFAGKIGSTAALPVEHWVQADHGTPHLDGFRRISPDYLDAGPVTPAPLDQRDTVAILHTSGTTGSPKGAMLSSRALLGGLAISGLYAPFVGRRDLALIALPWAHIMTISTVLYGLVAGVRGRFMTRFDAERAIAIIDHYKVSVFTGVPTMFQRLLDAAPPRERLKSIRIWICASDHLPHEARRRLRRYGGLFRLFGQRMGRSLFMNAYGMVELGGVALFGLDAPFLPTRAGLCMPVPPYRVRIENKRGDTVRWGGVGECLIKGPGVTNGYWKDEAATREALTPGGWLRTGDLARRFPGGLVQLVGRIKDVIKCGGYSIFASEVEDEIAEHPAVARAVVIGVPHRDKGEVPVGVVELLDGLRPDEDELLDWCRARIAPYKAPRRIHIVAAGEMPQGTTEKVLKQALRERYARDFE
ncbi:MAG: acyl--CoA ligase [Verrucomicrobia bacterium]|nr:acyl--CoA ligase [Verrucomicrobiota bacterium]